MKNILFAASFVFLTTAIFAQLSGTITFTETRKLQIHMDGNMPPPPGLPTENNHYTVLFYTQNASLYQNDGTKASDAGRMEEENMGGERMVIHMAPPDNKVYCDLTNKTMVRQEDFMQRKFLVESEMEMSGWKLTGKQKMILNYPCMEAVKEDSTQKIIAYFTSAIPVSSGPMDFVGLPGMVLEVNINDGMTIITANSVTPDVNPDEIKKPNDGKKVTEEEFDAIVDEKMKEMGIEGGDGPQIMIRIEED